jgi:hypothetical protein
MTPCGFVEAISQVPVNDSRALSIAFFWWCPLNVADPRRLFYNPNEALSTALMLLLCGVSHGRP